MSAEHWIVESIKESSFEDFYEWGLQLGSGATAKVYQCKRKTDRHEFAVKVIEKKIDRKIVRTEIGALLRMQHPNILRLEQVFETSSRILMVLELVTGGELFERIVEKTYYSESEAAQCVQEILRAVNELHHNGIVHRDLKPENLLYATRAEDSPVKIADFGLSKILQDHALMQTVCGTPGYCAPEVLRGVAYDAAVDMWSVGVIVYILLCGYEPFYDEDGDQAMFKRILKADYEFHDPWWNEVSDSAKDLVTKLLVLDPRKRLSSDQALSHPWLRSHASSPARKMTFAQTNMKKLNARRKFRAASAAVVTINASAKAAVLARAMSEQRTPPNASPTQSPGGSPKQKRHA